MNDCRCENCFYSFNTNTELKHGNHICRRYPPVPVAFIDAYETCEYTGGRKVLANATQIPVNHDWWCGEWKVRNAN